MGKKKKRKVESISKQPERGMMKSSFLCSKIRLICVAELQGQAGKRRK